MAMPGTNKREASAPRPNRPGKMATNSVPFSPAPKTQDTAGGRHSEQTGSAYLPSEERGTGKG